MGEDLTEINGGRHTSRMEVGTPREWRSARLANGGRHTSRMEVGTPHEWRSARLTNANLGILLREPVSASIPSRSSVVRSRPGDCLSLLLRSHALFPFVVLFSGARNNSFSPDLEGDSGSVALTGCVPFQSSVAGDVGQALHFLRVLRVAMCN